MPRRTIVCALSGLLGVAFLSIVTEARASEECDPYFSAAPGVLSSVVQIEWLTYRTERGIITREISVPYRHVLTIDARELQPNNTWQYVELKGEPATSVQGRNRDGSINLRQAKRICQILTASHLRPAEFEWQQLLMQVIAADKTRADLEPDAGPDGQLPRFLSLRYGNTTFGIAILESPSVIGTAGWPMFIGPVLDIIETVLGERIMEYAPDEYAPLKKKFM